MARSDRPHAAAQEQRWRQLVARWQASGLGVRDFCDREGIAEPSFYQWRRRFRQPPHTPSTPPQGTGLFLPVRLVEANAAATGPASASTIDVVLANGRRLSVQPGFAASTLRQLVHLLEELPC